MTKPIAVTDNVIDSILEACGCRKSTADDGIDDVDREGLARSVRQISAAFGRASADGDIDDAFGVFGSVFSDSRTMLLTWLDLLEEIVQVAEQRFGHASGQGKFKAEQVKAALRRTIDQSSSALRETVASLGAGAMDIVVDAALVVVVGVLNNRGMWDATGIEEHTARKTFRFRLTLVLVRWFGSIYGWLSLRQPLDPELFDEVDRIVSEGTDPLSMMENALEVALWIGNHPKQVESFMAIAATACDEAERFSRLDGPAKQAYARELIFLVLEEQFGVTFGVTTRHILTSVVDLVIDFVVSVNNKRGGFRHSGRPVSP